MSLVDAVEVEVKSSTIISIKNLFNKNLLEGRYVYIPNSFFMKVFFRTIIYSFFMLFSLAAFSQNKGVIRGRVLDVSNNAPIQFAYVVVEGTTNASVTDSLGRFEVKGIASGFVNLNISCLGYKKNSVPDIQVYNSRPVILEITLEKSVNQTKNVNIQANQVERNEVSPLSYKTIGVAEIQRTPGGNRDISKAIQSLPGVASGVSFRNDIIIRGGSPNENRFYLDGVEVPNINHFATQGASGGPVGLINVDLIREVEFFSGAFPANRGNTMSSVLEFKQKEARDDKSAFRFTIGSSDIGLLSEGPIGKSKKVTYLLSARRSYLQFLFSAIGLPFLPTYNDFQTKVKYRINAKNEVYFLGLGAIDKFELNLKANETEEQKYILGYLPVNTQWNYTNGLVWKNYRKNGTQTFVLSRNMLNNRVFKHVNNDETLPYLINYISQESENKFRYEYNLNLKGWKLNFGAGVERDRYTNSTYQQRSILNQVVIIDFNSKLYLNRYGLFGQASKTFLKDKLLVSAGLRMDGSDYAKSMNNPLKTLSPRISFSYNFAKRWFANANTGIYYQLPSYTVLGYRDRAGNLVNQNNVSYIQNKQVVLGVEYNDGKSFRSTFEGFYKQYSNYPFQILDSISLANLGSDFGVIGSAPVSGISTGRSYGIEYLAQQRMKKGFYGILSATLVRSEFSDKNGKEVPSSWDNRFFATLTAGKIFKSKWEIGIRYRYVMGTPYTPYDVATSSLKAVWDVNQQGLPNYSQLNTVRNSNFMQLDIRIDKKIAFDKWNLNFYFDVQNVTNTKLTGRPYLTVVRDENGNPVIDPASPASAPRYLMKTIPNSTGIVQPTIGVIIDF